MQKIKKKSSTHCQDIENLFYQHSFGMPGNVHPKYDNQFAALMELYLRAKNQSNSLSRC